MISFKIYLFLTVFFYFVLSSSSKEISHEHKLWRFQARPLRNGETHLFKENYIDINIEKHGIPFKSLSYCLRLAPKDLFSHCVFYEDNVKFIFIDESKFYGFLFFHGIYYLFKLHDSIAIVPEQWYHVCVSYEYKNPMEAHVKMYFDGISLIDKVIDTSHYRQVDTAFVFKPIWKLGYCKVSLLDPTVEIFRGNIRDFSVWSRALTKKEMLAFTRDCYIDTANNTGLEPDIIQWSTMQVNRSGGDAEMESLAFKRKENVLFRASCNGTNKMKTTPIKTVKSSFPLCHKDDFINVKLMKKITFEEAASTCYQLGGSMPLPTGVEHMEEIIPLENVNETIRKQEACQTHWIPITQGQKLESKDEYNWEHYEPGKRNKKLALFLPWHLGQPNGLEFQQCVVMAPETRHYYDVDCKEKHCFVCSLCKHIHFTLRGLPKELTKGENSRFGIDSRYIYIPKSHQTNEMRLEGYYDHKISLNQADGQWEITTVDNITVGRLARERNFPFGKNTWNVTTSKSSNIVATHTKKVLKLSHCNDESQFTCDDGTCISLEDRCDEISNCIDGSDEDRCKIVNIPDGTYHKQHPPLNVHGNRPLEVGISFDLFMLSEFIEVSFNYHAKFLLTVKWNDHRLQFADLKDVMFKNLIGSPEKETLWIPPLIFNNSEKNTMVTLDREPGDPVANILVEKRGKPTFAPPSVLDETSFYPGSESLVVYKTEYNMLLSCIYDLVYYPFDTQTCTIEIKSIPSMKNHMKLYADKVTYDGPKSLLELDVKNVTIRSEGLDHVFVEIKLKRRCLFHLATTYFPTLCIFVISEILLFMNEEHFETTIMVSLTAMLVMYTLHQSILSTLPKTSYMKMIDIWLLYGITIPFLVFMLEVTSQMLRHRIKIRRGKTNQMSQNMKSILHATIFKGYLERAVHNAQLEREQAKLSEIITDKVNHTDDYTLTENFILRYKKITIPLITTAFILGYALVALIHYIQY